MAALRLVEQGRVLETATVRLWPGVDRRSCCSPDALQRARRSAEWLGLPHQVLDLEAQFEGVVVAPFLRSYLTGETPNPCVACNPLRLGALVALADRLGLERVATGHYARLVQRHGETFVARGADAVKDQSYMLWAVPPEVLARLEFPLGGWTKTETRAAAEAAGLPAAAEPESQEVCFAGEGYRGFIEARGLAAAAGPIVDESGAVLGRHAGFWRYTVGQRRGLGVSAPAPLYVLAVDAATNTVVVGPRTSLRRRDVFLRDVVARGLGDGRDLMVQLRYRSPAVSVDTVEVLPEGRVRLLLAASFEGPAPGQSAVFYRGDVVVGGGLVDSPGGARHAPPRATEGAPADGL